MCQCNPCNALLINVINATHPTIIKQQEMLFHEHTHCEIMSITHLTSTRKYITPGIVHELLKFALTKKRDTNTQNYCGETGTHIKNTAITVLHQWVSGGGTSASLEHIDTIYNHPNL